MHSATAKQSDNAKSFTVTVTGKNLQFLREVQWRRLGTLQQIEARDFGIAEDHELVSIELRLSAYSCRFIIYRVLFSMLLLSFSNAKFF